MDKGLYADQLMVISNHYKEVNLFKLNRGGALMNFHIMIDWRIDQGTPCYCVTTQKGLVNGAMQEDIYPIREGKNIGRANETNALQQALTMFNSIFNKQRDKGYVDITTHDNSYDTIYKIAKGNSGKDASGNLKPMLAYKTIKYIKFPCYCQRKYDGIRCFISWGEDGKLHLSSRNGKEFEHLDHIKVDLLKRELVAILKLDEILDGELYSHTMNFQQIISAVKKEQPQNKEIKLRAYDVANDHKQDRRLRRLKTICKHAGPSIEYCPTYKVNNLEEAKALFAIFIEEGYEGMILRNEDSYYEFGTRSHNLAKYKEFDEEEFEIIAVHEATGRDIGTGVFELITKSGNTFRARPIGSRKVRREYLTNRDYYIGKIGTVKYQGLSDTGIPRFPIFKTCRDYE